MSSPVAMTGKGQPVTVRRTKVDFWNGAGVGHTAIMPSITPEGTTTHLPCSHIVVANGRVGEMRGCGHIRGGTIWGRRL